MFFSIYIIESDQIKKMIIEIHLIFQLKIIRMIDQEDSSYYMRSKSSKSAEFNCRIHDSKLVMIG